MPYLAESISHWTEWTMNLVKDKDTNARERMETNHVIGRDI
jgi:hypothetical protein